MRLPVLLPQESSAWRSVSIMLFQNPLNPPAILTCTFSCAGTRLPFIQYVVSLVLLQAIQAEAGKCSPALLHHMVMAASLVLRHLPWQQDHIRCLVARVSLHQRLSRAPLF